MKIYELALLIWKYKSSKPEKKFLVFSIILKQLTQSEIIRCYIWQFAWSYYKHIMIHIDDYDKKFSTFFSIR